MGLNSFVICSFDPIRSEFCWVSFDISLVGMYDLYKKHTCRNHRLQTIKTTLGFDHTPILKHTLNSNRIKYSRK